MKSTFFKFIIFLPVLVFANDLAQNTPPAAGGNTTPPDMPIPPGFANQPQAPQNSAPQAAPAPGAQAPAVVPNAPPISPGPQGANLAAPSPEPVPPTEKTADAQAPNDFELISIKPYFKNKNRVGHLTATLINAQTGQAMGTVNGDLGDCKNCIRGASLKGKVGVRFYGQTLQSLTFSRKSSSSIKLLACPSVGSLASDHTYNCEFAHAGGPTYKLVLKIEP